MTTTTASAGSADRADPARSRHRRPRSSGSPGSPGSSGRPRRTRAWFTVPAAAGLALVLSLSSPAGADAERPGWAGTIDLALADPRLHGAQSSVVVADAATGEVLYERNGENRLMPASNSKLPTSVAALDILGPGYTYPTDVLATGRISHGRLRGDLYLRGTGDPTLLHEDYAGLARQLADAGVRTVTGDLVADDTRFDDEHFHWGWNVDDEQYYYGAPVSALTVAPDTDYDAGTVIVTVTPGEQPGDRPEVSVWPDSGFLTVRNTAATVAGSSATPSITRVHGQDVLVVDGSIGADRSPVRVWRAVHDPTGHAAAVFATALAEHGITVRGGTRLGEAAPAGARVLASHESMTVGELMNPFMKLSNNGHAEVLIKTIGWETSGEGSWSAGIAAARTSVAGFGMDPDTYVLADGSGLTRRNWIPSAELADLLIAVRDEEWFPGWYAQLPVACEPGRLTGGTLRSRMCGTPAEKNAHAKTGTLTGATALSGYVTDADGRELVFSVVLNYYLGAAPKDIEDRIVTALAAHGAAGTDGTDGAEPAAEQPRSTATAPAEPGAQQPRPGTEHDAADAKPADPTLR
ncbi:D-alanyl-D-alanine carboxypeptidase/D-alanyl-D-alanine-endopeptidase [Streptomyces sp. YIM 98790]|uniref:D-alanyl-D-alanine carboxypeptidase/D-alanyl-D-alanine endopeptidase n=1 Tax=Streptomyces sp. YIM 98790 TaxID=2689077 RepID=UPI001407E3D6|nr:D-alanyl-D-alanine carboxypeptidase/D-alanyl-D-alanine-endopeptidase [Streptomyces sp. YIM 98790]